MYKHNLMTCSLVNLAGNSSNSRGISSATPKTFFNDGRRSTANTHARIDAAVAHLSAIGQQFQNNNEVAPKARPATAHGNSQQYVSG